MLSFQVWHDEERPERSCLHCTAENSGGLGSKISDQNACRKFGELKSDIPRFRAQLNLEPSAPLWMAKINLAGHELGDRAVRALVEALLAGSTLVQVIELYKNRLSDVSAQALSVLLEHSPSPGVHGFHLSHNYFTPLGVGLLLASAARSGYYPARRSWRGTELRCPMWLRVEQQLIKWEALSGLPEEEQKHRAELLLEEKSASLIKRCQAEGRYFPEFLPDFKLLCMPEGFESEISDSKEISPRRHRSCSSWCCVHIQEDEQKWPMVHLPYFWSQKAIHTLEPPEGHLLKFDPGWRHWRPRMPFSVLGRRPESRLPLPAPSFAPLELAEVPAPRRQAQEPKELPKEVQKIEMKSEKGDQSDKKPKKEKKEKSEKAKKEKKEKDAKKDKDEKKEKRKAKKEEGTLQVSSSGRGRNGRGRGRGRPKGGKAKVLPEKSAGAGDGSGHDDDSERRKRVFGNLGAHLGTKVLRLEQEDVEEDDTADAEVKDEDELLCRSSSFSQNLRLESEANEAIELDET